MFNRQLPAHVVRAGLLSLGQASAPDGLTGLPPQVTLGPVIFGLGQASLADGLQPPGGQCLGPVFQFRAGLSTRWALGRVALGQAHVV